MKRLLPKSQFFRHVLTLLTGTTLAQAIPIAIAPILTRMYTPEDFGIFALYMAVVSIASIFATGRYESAIMLPSKDEEAANLVALSIMMSCFVGFISFIFLFFFNQSIAGLLGNREVSSWLHFIPLTIILVGTYQSLNYWCNRSLQYKRLAISRVSQSGFASAIQIGSGIGGMGVSGLIIGDIFSKIMATSILLKMVWNSDKKILNRAKIKNIIILAKRYRKFPIYDMFAGLANISSYQIQNILFPTLYGLVSAGHYFLVLRVLQAPLSLISSALTDVYKQKLTSKNTAQAQLKVYYKKMFLFLFLTGIVPFSLITLFAEDFFIFVFGNAWGGAGRYTSLLAPMFFIRFIASPLSYFFYLKEKQEVNVFGHILLLLSVLFSFYIGKSSFEVVIVISLTFSLVYMWYIMYSAKLAGFIMFEAVNGK